MGMAIKVRMLMAARQMTLKQLGEQINPPTTAQNLSQKLNKDNLNEKDLSAIAKACNATFEGIFRLNDTGKEI